jgi:hypothetical protein
LKHRQYCSTLNFFLRNYYKDLCPLMEIFFFVINCDYLVGRINYTDSRAFGKRSLGGF